MWHWSLFHCLRCYLSGYLLELCCWYLQHWLWHTYCGGVLALWPRQVLGKHRCYCSCHMLELCGWYLQHWLWHTYCR